MGSKGRHVVSTSTSLFPQNVTKWKKIGTDKQHIKEDQKSTPR